jgi:hypothetical protein
MHDYPHRVFQHWRRTWYRWHGERRLLTTFWPADYQRGATYLVAGRRYRITRYLRATHLDRRFFEVWGHATAVVPAVPVRWSSYQWAAQAARRPRRG